ncbi:hypothetical protein CC99x_005310 [Candidatus Berkiella cookevillensis]|uniref:Uncharacterized protein n=1 Tax=Candidatus Berkiella cookevillensis TaxID=437022 RepID=A0A0Q9YTX0_9GAMM|nr:hypothetical protein [Candidatus Berkiella cookevillensis]MCS5708319.1 hypothetical protein [Candidatus Berkiella cookevillensis]
MADNDNKNDEFEDEFEFDSDENFDADADLSSQADTAPVAERKKSSFPWLIAVAVLGGIGFGGYQFIKSGSDESVGEITTPPPAQQAKTPAPAPTVAPHAALPAHDPMALADEPPAVAQSEASQPSMALDSQLDSLAQQQSIPTPDTATSTELDAAVSKTKQDLEKSLGGLKKDITSLTESNTQKIKDIEKDLELTAGKMVNVDRSLGDIHQDIKQLTQIVKSLTEQVNELYASREAYKADQANKARKARVAASSAPKKSTVSQSMTIHAIIPGRAWLRTQEGKTLSVAEGDMLGEYGKILKIDAPTGTVITSSGVTIR